MKLLSGGTPAKGLEFSKIFSRRIFPKEHYRLSYYFREVCDE